MMMVTSNLAFCTPLYDIQRSGYKYIQKPTLNTSFMIK